MNLLSLFRRECGQIAKGVLYFVFVVAVILFYFTQFYGAAENDIAEYRTPSTSMNDYKINDYSTNPLIKPVPGQKDYGYVRTEIPEQIMPAVTVSLCREYIENHYVTYPIGFYKNVKLNEEQQSRVAEILTEITGLSPEDLWNLDSDAQQKAMVEGPGGVLYVDEHMSYHMIPIQVTYLVFKERMAEVDSMLGGGSAYSADGISTSSSRPITYEEKMAEYEESLQEGGITGPYARLFCDYMGIVLGLFSVFVPVSFLLRDKRAHMRELIESRSCGSVKLIAARYLACVVMILLPVLVLSLIPLAQLAVFGWKEGLPVQLFAFARYILFWILPTVMVCVSVGFFFTLLTDTPLAIAIQFIWSFVDVFMGGGIEGGIYETDLIIRHNSLGNLQLMQNAMSELIGNRLFYTGAALLLLVASMVRYEWKRRGILDVYGSLQKILGHFRSTAPAHSGS